MAEAVGGGGLESSHEPSERSPFCAPVSRWFAKSFEGPTEAQREGWSAIAAGRDTLISAPTGSGKTLAAFLVAIDRLVRRALEGGLEERLSVVYVSPLRALSHDIQRNLERPLAEIRREAAAAGLVLPEIRALVRTGDTPPAERARMQRRPPHILVTTPESLFLLLTAERSRAWLGSVETLIVDEIHAVARDKRGSHLALSLARLDALAERRPQRVGLSATQRPIELLARFLVGAHAPEPGSPGGCAIVDRGHRRALDLGVEIPASEDLCAVMSREQWDEVVRDLAQKVAAHRTTLVFTNTRRLAERLAHTLGGQMGEGEVAAHHGSLSRERRLRVEAKLRAGELRALVATASLELGIDIGHVDLVCQIGSPRSIATFLQRVGRSGHALGLTPRGRLYPTTRDELVECAALVRAVRAGRLDAIALPRSPLDILAQQLVALSSCEEWDEDALFELCTSATGFEALSRADFDDVLEMLARGLETTSGRRGAWLHRDRLQGRVRARRGARLAALLSGGAIPETGDYRVVLDPDETFLGTVNEDWAIESMAGDIFLLGTHSWQIRRVESGVVRVVDAGGKPPTIPFWLGEAPARTAELSAEVSELRADIVRALEGGAADTEREFGEACALPEAGARQLVHYVRAQLESIGRVPTREELVAERFFDESGGMQLVVHSPYGGRINRGLGLALRKRFCRAFNQELQAAASDDAVVLSLGNAQTFPLSSLPDFLRAETIESVLAQAMLGSPLFGVRWRWNATRALSVLRANGKGRVPFPIQRMRADDLLGAAFPEQAACQEHVQYPIEIPDHPLVQQTVRDCLHEAGDLDGLRSLLERIESGEVRFHTLDTVEPSPFAHEILNARPYTFLDDAPLEERRTRAVRLRRVLPEHARDLGRLDPEAIKRVRDEALPRVRDADELYELLLDLVAVDPRDPLCAPRDAQTLLERGRAALLRLPDRSLLFAAERLGEIRALHPGTPHEPALELPAALAERQIDAEGAVDLAARGYLAILGPTTSSELAHRLALDEAALEAALARLEARGVALRGEFAPEVDGEQFCDRSLLARIHGYTLARLRREIEPVSAQVFWRFLTRWQHAHAESTLMGESGLLAAIEQLAGFEAPAAAWESALLPARVRGYGPELLDALCLSGAVSWGRLSPQGVDAATQPTRATPISLVPRAELDALLHAAGQAGGGEPGEQARIVLARLRERGALFARELGPGTGLVASQLESALRELVARGLVSCDGFAPLRRLMGSRTRRSGPSKLMPQGRVEPDGRWHRLEPLGPAPDTDERAERAARRLLRRYGVVFRDLLARELLPEGWREVHRALRRLEARGEVRGGRFVTGFTGEQFALPDAIPLLRKERSAAHTGAPLRISAADPLNLLGVLTPGARLPAGHTRWLLLEHGLPVAVLDRGGRRELPRPAEGW
jgi:ATP-dependent Lhr-like helicase